MVLLVVLHEGLVVLDSLVLLLNFKLILHVLLEQIVDFFCFFVNLYLALGNLVNKSVSLPMQVLDHLDFSDVLPLEHFDFDLELLVLISLNY